MGPHVAEDSPAVTHPNLPSNDEIISAVTRFLDARWSREVDEIDQPLDGGSWTGFVYPSATDPIAYVKCARSIGEARMQTYAYEHLQKVAPDVRQNIRVPEIYRVIEHGSEFGAYIVMEYVRGLTIEAELEKCGEDPQETHVEEQLLALATKAISLFIDFPVSPSTKPGSGEGCRILHAVFKDQEAPIEYNSVAELGRHFTKVGTKDKQKNPRGTWFNLALF